MRRKLSKFTLPLLISVTMLSGCKPNQSFKVTFDTDGGSEVATQEVKSGEKAKKPETNPTKAGYTFVNWYTSKEGTEEFNFDTQITKDTTIYAHWKVATFKATFDTDGGSEVASQEIKSGGCVTKPTDPTKDGYAFINWFVSKESNELFDFETPITKDTTIYAHWIKTAETAEELKESLAKGEDVLLTDDITLEVAEDCAFEIAKSQKIYGDGHILSITLNNSIDHSSVFKITGENTTVFIDNLSIETNKKQSGKYDSILVKNAFNSKIELNDVTITHEVEGSGYSLYILNQNEKVEDSLPGVDVTISNCDFSKSYTAIRNHGSSVNLIAESSNFSSTNISSVAADTSSTICLAQYPIWADGYATFGAAINANNHFEFEDCNFEAKETGNAPQRILQSLSPLNNTVTFKGCEFTPSEGAKTNYVFLCDDDIADLDDTQISGYCSKVANEELQKINSRDSLFKAFPASEKITVDDVEYTRKNKDSEQRFVIAKLDENGDPVFE